MVSTEKSVALPGFFGEVRRRKVYRVVAAYIIAAGGIIQLASAAFPAWELPSWALRALIVCLLMGFPLALMLAWAFDITAHGIQATPDTAASSTHTAWVWAAQSIPVKNSASGSANGTETPHDGSDSPARRTATGWSLTGALRRVSLLPVRVPAETGGGGVMQAVLRRPPQTVTPAPAESQQ